MHKVMQIIYVGSDARQCSAASLKCVQDIPETQSDVFGIL